MAKPITQFERFMSFIKNNKVLAIAATVGVIIISIGSTTNALTIIVDTLSRLIRSAPHIEGSWSTDTMQRLYNWPLRCVFELENAGTVLTGTMKTVYILNDREETDTNTIYNGTLNDDHISFVVKYRMDDHIFEDSYIGTISHNEIHFVHQSDPRLGIPTEKFTARKN